MDAVKKFLCQSISELGIMNAKRHKVLADPRDFPNLTKVCHLWGTACSHFHCQFKLINVAYTGHLEDIPVDSEPKLDPLRSCLVQQNPPFPSNASLPPPSKTPLPPKLTCVTVCGQVLPPPQQFFMCCNALLQAQLTHLRLLLWRDPGNISIYDLKPAHLSSIADRCPNLKVQLKSFTWHRQFICRY
jgi:hypothetical protein